MPVHNALAGGITAGAGVTAEQKHADVSKDDSHVVWARDLEAAGMARSGIAQEEESAFTACFSSYLERLTRV